MNLNSKITEWLKPPFDEATQSEVKNLKKNPNKLKMLFIKIWSLELGALEA